MESSSANKPAGAPSNAPVSAPEVQRPIDMLRDLKNEIESAKAEGMDEGEKRRLKEKLEEIRARQKEEAEAADASIDEQEMKEAAEVEVEMEDVERRINESDDTQPALKEEAPVSPQLNKLQDLMKKGSEMFKKVLENAVKILPLGLLKFIQAKNPFGLGEMLDGFITERDTLAKMESILKPATILATEEDKNYVRQLKEEYGAIPEPKEGEGKKLTFDQFTTAKINEAKRPGKQEYTLKDIVDAKTPAQKLADAESRDKRVEEETGKKKAETERKHVEKTRQLSELAAENPDVNNAIYTFALANGLREFIGDKLILDKKEIEKDLSGTREDAYYYKTVGQKIKSILEDNTIGQPLLGLEMDGGDLEEAEGGMASVWENDIIKNFDPAASPLDAVAKLLALKFADGNELADGTNINATARARLPVLQEKISSELKRQLDSFVPSFVRPEEQPAPAPAEPQVEEVETPNQ